MTVGRGDLLVGREREMAELTAVLVDALAGHGRIVMLVGEPGIGKTRTAQELSDIGRGRGAEVLWGRCSEEAGAPAFWPWMQIIRSYLRGHDIDELRVRFGTRAADLAQIEPEVRALLPETGPAPGMDDPESARFRLFDSVATLLRSLTESRPVILVLDDLQWADAASVKLLEFVASEIPESRLLIMGTYRDVEMSRRHPLPATLDTLSRYRNFRRLHLRGLSEDAVGRMVGVTAGTLPAKAVVEAIFGQTEGNPLFVREMARLLADQGLLAGSQADGGGIKDFGLPGGIREAIGRRLNSLSQPCNAVLSVASVVGRQFNLSLLSRLVVVEERPPGMDVTAGSGASTRRLGFQTPGKHPAGLGHQSKLSQASPLLNVIQDALDEAEAARLIEKASPDDDAYVFTHSVIQRTLEDELPTKTRAQL
ncbi:MAG: AAA family ATPase, partial [Chloroflexi bacterium]|nr:AAA family ATPase [Chloroflexota bacterium]